MKTLTEIQEVAKMKASSIVEFKPANDGANLLCSGKDEYGNTVCNIYKSFDSSFQPVFQIRYTNN